MFSLSSWYYYLKVSLSSYLGARPRSRRSAITGGDDANRRVYLLGLSTYNSGEKYASTQITETFTALSTLGAEKVQKYMNATRVDYGRVGFPTQVKETKEMINLPLKERFELNENISVKMAKETVAELFKTSNIKPKDITHIVTCTCTAFFNPGLETVIPEHFGMSEDVFGVNVNFMGCHAGVKTLNVATALAAANPGARVLYICSEVCSTHIPPSLDTAMDIIVAGLFRDGCAAGIVGTNPLPGEKPLFEVGERNSIRIPKSVDEMTWKMGQDRILFFLSKQIPELVCKSLLNIRKYIPDINKCRVALHPGGPAVVLGAAHVMGIPERDYQHSMNLLKNSGNMSSASIMYVFKSMMEEIEADKEAGKPAQDVILMAFGPGLTTECCRMKPVQAK